MRVRAHNAAFGGARGARSFMNACVGHAPYSDFEDGGVRVHRRAAPLYRGCQRGNSATVRAAGAKTGD